MRKLYSTLLTLSLSGILWAQNEPTVPEPEDQSFYAKNGENEITEVQFHYQLSDSLSIELLREIIRQVMSKAEYQVSKSASFVPRALTLTHHRRKGYRAELRYVSSNQSGMLREYVTTFQFNLEGKVMAARE